MTDIKISNGDIACDSAGNYEFISGAEAMLQRAWICACVVLGSFIYDRELGADIKSVDFTQDDAKDRLQLVIDEAVAKYKNTKVEVLSLEEKVSLKITVDGKSEIREVDYNGYI